MGSVWVKLYPCDVMKGVQFGDAKWALVTDSGYVEVTQDEWRHIQLLLTKRDEIDDKLYAYTPEGREVNDEDE